MQCPLWNIHRLLIQPFFYGDSQHFMDMQQQVVHLLMTASSTRQLQNCAKYFLAYSIIYHEFYPCSVQVGLNVCLAVLIDKFHRMQYLLSS